MTPSSLLISLSYFPFLTFFWPSLFFWCVFLAELYFRYHRSPPLFRRSPTVGSCLPPNSLSNSGEQIFFGLYLSFSCSVSRSGLYKVVFSGLLYDHLTSDHFFSPPLRRSSPQNFSSLLTFFGYVCAAPISLWFFHLVVLSHPFTRFPLYLPPSQRCSWFTSSPSLWLSFSPFLR